MNKQKDFIDRIESELLISLLRYAVPFLKRKTKILEKPKSSLEHVVNAKPKIRLEDVKELENLIAETWASKDSVEIKNNETFSVSIKYEENGNEEKLSVSSGKEIYAEIHKIKNPNDGVVPYRFEILYEKDHSGERLTLIYKDEHNNYIKQFMDSKEDMTLRVPLKWLNIHPESQMGGILGFTYLGDHSMGRRADLTGKMARMVDIHESIHTPDEYETRVLTDWILEKPKLKYIK